MPETHYKARVETVMFIALFIFGMKFVEVCLETMRLQLTIKHHQVLAPTVAFIEVIIWLVVCRQAIMREDWYNYMAYAGGYAAGTYMGMVLMKKFLSKRKEK